MRIKQNPYKNQKEQISSIMRRIDKKRSMEIFLQRSQGNFVQNQIQFQLKNIQKKRQQKSKTFNFSNHYRNRVTPQRKIKTQNLNKFQFNLGQNKNLMPQSINNGNQLEKNNKQKENLNYILSQLKQKNKFRPQLQDYNNYLSVKDPVVLKRRRKIIQMLILCLMRRCHNKLQQALDLAIQVSSFFEEKDSEIILKSICLTLIGKIYNQNVQKFQKQKKLIKNTETKLKINNKRHSSLMIKTLASQRAFFNRFTHKFKKARLIKETTFKRQEQLKAILQNCDNRFPIQNLYNESKIQFKNNYRNRVSIVTQINSQLAVTLAHPSSLFNQNSTNYKVIIHQRDKQNNLFPYQYPTSLVDLIQKKDYITMVSNINGIIFPMANCYNMLSSLKLNYTSLFFGFMFLFISLLSVQYWPQTIFFNYIIILFCIVPILVCCYLFLRQNKNQTFIYIYERLLNQLEKWQKKYEKYNLKLRCSEGFQAFFICSQINEDQQSVYSDSVSEQYKDSINQQNQYNIGSGSIFCKQSTPVLQTIKEHSFGQVQESVNLSSEQQIKKSTLAKSQPAVQFQSQSQDQIVNQGTIKTFKRNSNINLDCFEFIKDQQSESS